MTWKKRIFLLAAGLLVVAVLVICVISVLIPERQPIEISREEADTFGWAEGESERYKAFQLRPIPNSPFVFCGFLSNVSLGLDASGAAISGSTEVVVLIDLERGKRVLRVQWRNQSRSGAAWIRRGYVLTAVPVFVVDTHPVIQFLEDRYYALSGPFRVFGSFLDRSLSRASRMIPILPRLTVSSPENRSEELWELGPSGDLRKPVYPFGLIPIPGSNRFLAAGEGENDSCEYILEDGNLRKNIEWKAAGRFFGPDLVVGDGFYFGRPSGGRRLAFQLRTRPPSVREIGEQEFIDLLPPSAAGTSYIGPHFLAGNRSRPPLFYVRTAGGFPVFEIQSEEIAKGRVSEIFRLVGKDFPGRPIAALKKNEIILFASKAKEFPSHTVIQDDQPLLFRERRKTSSGRWGEYSSGLREIPIPPAPRAYSLVPIDDEHLLFYREGALWTMRWDGKEERIFPR